MDSEVELEFVVGGHGERSVLVEVEMLGLVVQLSVDGESGCGSGSYKIGCCGGNSNYEYIH